MKRIPTPRTDAAWAAFCIDETSEPADPWGLAARLEKELAIVVAQRQSRTDENCQLKKEVFILRGNIKSLENERDTAREQRDRLKNS